MKNLILDGNNIAFRAFHVLRGEVSPADVAQHFFKMTYNYIKKFNPRKVYITWDKRLNPAGKNFRKDGLDDYKGGRNVDTDVSDTIFKSIDIVTEVGESLGIVSMFPWSLEADDVIAFLVDKLEGGCVIVSSDKDILQLVSDSVWVVTSKNVTVTPENFEENAGIDKDHFILYKSIMGDKSDNIEGLMKYGPVKSKRLALSGISKLSSDQKDIVNRNIKMIDLAESTKHSEGELSSYVNQLDRGEEFSVFDGNEARRLCKHYNLNGMLREIESWKGILNNRTIMEDWFSDILK